MVGESGGHINSQRVYVLGCVDLYEHHLFAEPGCFDSFHMEGAVLATDPGETFMVRLFNLPERFEGVDDREVCGDAIRGRTVELATMMADHWVRGRHRQQKHRLG